MEMGVYISAFSWNHGRIVFMLSGVGGVERVGKCSVTVSHPDHQANSLVENFHVFFLLKVSLSSCALESLMFSCCNVRRMSNLDRGEVVKQVSSTADLTNSRGNKHCDECIASTWL
jgi:hypothetical protein